MPGRSGRDEKQFGAPTGYEPPSSAQDRPKPGPADDDTVRQNLRAALNPPRASKPAAPATPPPEDTPTKDLSIIGAAGKLQGRKSQIDQAIKDAGG